jgi:hypothetical protein
VFELSGALARDTNKVNVGGGQIVVMKCVQRLSCSKQYDAMCDVVPAGTRSLKMLDFPFRSGECALPELLAARFRAACQCAFDARLGTCSNLVWTRSWR